MERINLKKVKGKEKYCVEVSNRFAAMKHLDGDIDVKSAWKTITENINISAKDSLGYYKLKAHKLWLEVG
jgi:hypothetical protein